MALQNAKIYILGENDSVSSEITCSFNPSEYKISSDAKYKEENTLQQSQLIFTAPGLSTFTVALYFSTVSSADLYKRGVLQEPSDSTVPPVTNLTQKIVSAVYIEGKLHKPPLVRFVWGNLDFRGVLVSVTENYTMFTSSGKPVRAKLDLTIREQVDGILTTKSHPFESPDRTKWLTLTEDMSFWALAQMHYNDAGKWRLIAEANQIDNPLMIEKGKIIKIPAL